MRLLSLSKWESELKKKYFFNQLETDEEKLLPKAKAALTKYGHQLVTLMKTLLYIRREKS